MTDYISQDGATFDLTRVPPTIYRYRVEIALPVAPPNRDVAIKLIDATWWAHCAPAGSYDLEEEEIDGTVVHMRVDRVGEEEDRTSAGVDDGHAPDDHAAAIAQLQKELDLAFTEHGEDSKMWGCTVTSRQVVKPRALLVPLVAHVWIAGDEPSSLRDGHILRKILDNGPVTLVGARSDARVHAGVTLPWINLIDDPPGLAPYTPGEDVPPVVSSWRRPS